MDLKALMRRKLQQGELIRGTHVTMNDPVISELLGYAGFDFLWVDTEHTAIDYRDLVSHICFAHQAGTPVLVRVHRNDDNHTKRVLDMGPDGVIFPMINTAAEAAAAMDSCLYPPLGARGFGPRGAVRYVMDDVSEYVHKRSVELCRFIQIETETAVSNLPDIITNPHIDGFVIGPCDLSNSVGEHNQVFGDRTTSLIKEAVEILKGTGKIIAISIGAPAADTIAYWRGLGMDMISAGVDTDYLLNGARAAFSAFDEACAGTASAGQP